MKHEERLKDAVDFLMWSYFNLALNDGDKIDRILGISVSKAYSDATQQGAYNTSLKGDDLKSLAREAEKAAGKELLKQIDALTSDKLRDYNEWHTGICTKITEKYAQINQVNREKLFSYGNAQKWVNMTLKYLYMLYWLYDAFSPECDFCQSYGSLIKNYASSFHIPVDSFIIDTLWTQTDIELPLKEDKTTRGKDYKHPSDYVTAWSKWSGPVSGSEPCSDYEKFQKTMQNHTILQGKSQLEWEGPAWIAEAKRRKANSFAEIEKLYKE